MKKRSMLAIASLATGFVVAAITPSHGLGDELTELDVNGTLSAVDKTLASDSFAMEENALGGNSQSSGGGRSE
ncbi:hypothetical protein ACIQNG_13945 [Streptomyces sp. NPDC091377]|uniref:hypothetical protein n=1 Tax=unclassified Streptomyces TaxID=2593676 RepID=UPI00382CA892